MHMRNDHAVLLIERNVVRSRRPSPAAIEIAPPAPPKLRRVLLRIDPSDAFARGVLVGVARYHREHAGWSICIRPDEAAEWSGDGVIACGEQALPCERGGSVAIVNLAGPTPIVSIDEPHIARLAVQHLLERGLHQFAFVGPQ